MKLIRYRRLNELSAAKLCRDLGISRGTLSRYETGERFPRPETLIKINAVTNGQVTAQDFLQSRKNGSKTA